MRVLLLYDHTCSDVVKEAASAYSSVAYVVLVSSRAAFDTALRRSQRSAHDLVVVHCISKRTAPMCAGGGIFPAQLGDSDVVDVWPLVMAHKQYGKLAVLVADAEAGAAGRRRLKDAVRRTYPQNIPFVVLRGKHQEPGALSRQLSAHLATDDATRHQQAQLLFASLPWLRAPAGSEKRLQLRLETLAWCLWACSSKAAAPDHAPSIVFVPWGKAVDAAPGPNSTPSPLQAQIHRRMTMPHSWNVATPAPSSSPTAPHPAAPCHPHPPPAHRKPAHGPLLPIPHCQPHPHSTSAPPSPILPPQTHDPSPLPPCPIPPPTDLLPLLAAFSPGHLPSPSQLHASPYLAPVVVLAHLSDSEDNARAAALLFRDAVSADMLPFVTVLDFTALLRSCRHREHLFGSTLALVERVPGSHPCVPRVQELQGLFPGRWHKLTNAVNANLSAEKAELRLQKMLAIAAGVGC